MAQSVRTSPAGRVNRRFLFLALILAALAAVLVYAAISRSGDDGVSAVDIPVVVATGEIPAGTLVTEEMVELRSIPEHAVGDQALRTTDAVVGRVTRYPISPNEQILLPKVVSGEGAASNDVLSHVLESGQRGMAIDVEAVVTAGALALPGDHVDVLWIPNEPRSDVPGAQLLAENVEVVAVSQTVIEIPVTAPGVVEEGEENVPNNRTRGSEADPDTEAITVTLMLTPEEATRVFCGDEAGILRLAVRAFGDDSPSGLEPVTCVILGNET